MKRIFAMIATAAAAILLLAGCKGNFRIVLSDYNYKVNEEFSLTNGISIENDFDGIIDASDDSKWTFVISDEVVANREKRGNFVKFTAPYSGTVQAIYDAKTQTNPNGKDIHSNVASIRITQ